MSYKNKEEELLKELGIKGPMPKYITPACFCPNCGTELEASIDLHFNITIKKVVLLPKGSTPRTIT